MVKLLLLKKFIGFTQLKSRFKSFEKRQKDFEGWVFIFLLEKSFKVIKILIYMKVDNFFNIDILLEGL